ncbi:MAG: Rne/Rng family ribonuclease, partial [Pseudomonadota bacterium]
VLMPNTARGGGISRKITNAADRKRLKAIAQDLDVPEGMGLIIRTAGAARTKQEIKRDFEYLLRLWESVRELTLNSTAPALVYEEGNLIKRAIRDLYTKDVEEIVVSGGEAHREAKDFMRMLMPSHAKNVVKYDEQESVFKRYGIESQLNALFSPNVTLPSGGYLVINQTEALVAIDINSGRATREFSIEGTAHRTNTEAAEEIARQLKLRDLAGLIVIDFIDMEENRNNRAVERKIKDCLKDDRARIQVGRISPFGLLEMSRQRLRTGMLEGSTSQCEHCQGTGIVRSVESVALAVIRGIEDAAEPDGSDLIVKTARDVAFYILNQKRTFITDLEARYGISIQVQFSEAQQGASFAIETPTGQRPPRRTGRSAVSMDHGFKGQASSAPSPAPTSLARTSLAPTSPASVTAIDVVTVDDDEDDNRKPRRRRRRRGGRRDDAPDTDDTNLAALDAEAQADDDDEAEADDTGRDGDQRRSRRRGRRSGQRGRGRDQRRDTEEGDDTGLVAGDELGTLIDDQSAAYVAQSGTVASAAAAARRRPRSNRTERVMRAAEGLVITQPPPRPHRAAEDTEGREADGDADRPTRKPRRTRGGRSRRKSAETVVNGAEHAAEDAARGEVLANGADPAVEAPGPETIPPSASVDVQARDADAVNGHDTAADHAPAAQEGEGVSDRSARTANGAAQPEVSTAEEMSAAEADALETNDAQPRAHWGEPTSSEPVVNRVTIGADAETGSDLPPTVTPSKPQKRGWWQRNFG